MIKIGAQQAAGLLRPAIIFLVKFLLGDKNSCQEEDLTGIEAESWHFRYVGKDMAKLVRDSGLTFDEIYKKISGNDKLFVQKSVKPEELRPVQPRATWR